MPNYNDRHEFLFLQARELIDNIDMQIVELLAQRSICIASIAKIKQINNLAVRDGDRENIILDRVTKEPVGFYHANDVAKVFYAIFQAGINQQLSCKMEGE